MILYKLKWNAMIAGLLGRKEQEYYTSLENLKDSIPDGIGIDLNTGFYKMGKGKTIESFPLTLITRSKMDERFDEIRFVGKVEVSS